MDKKTVLFILALFASFYLINNVLFPPKPVVPPPQAMEAPTSQKREAALDRDGELLYVLESPYQQLVFSSLGGSLSEINLPLRGPENMKSEVRPIRVDRLIAKDYPSTDYFPLKPYMTSDGKREPKEGGYYPLMRRSASPAAYALAITANDAPISSFKMTELSANRITFEGEVDGCRVTKTYSFPQEVEKAPYCFDLDIQVEGDARDLKLVSGIPEVEIISDSFNPSLKYHVTRGDKSVTEQIDLPKTNSNYSATAPDWVCNSNGFLGIILDPRASDFSKGFTASYVKGEAAPTRLAVIDSQYDLYPASKYPGYLLELPLSATKSSKVRLFAGPIAANILDEVDAFYKNPETGVTPEYASAISFHGWFSFISEPFAKFLFFLMKVFHAITQSWGFSIILLTAALRLMLYPLNAWSTKSTIKMQKVAPKVAQVQARFKKDPKQMQIEVMRIYREEGINPLGGCLPLLIQMPFLIGMFDLLKSTFELRGVPFIPGWIDNLTAPDIVFSWSYPIWFFGTSLHLLPLLLGAVMYWQQKMSSALPKDKSNWSEQQKQQSLMGNIMVVVFAVLFYHFPSGLNLYWLFSMLFAMLQQWWTVKRLPPPTTTARPY